MNRIINLTPHDIQVGEITFYHSQTPARAESEYIDCEDIKLDVCNDNYIIPTQKMKIGKPIDLPKPKKGYYYIVSMITVRAAKQSGRTIDDLLVSLKPERDKTGKIIGCKALGRI